MKDRSIQIKALSSQTRIEILRLLVSPQTHFSHQWSADPAEFGVCISLIAEALELSQPTVSRHIDLLRQAGFLSSRRFQKWSYCKRNEENLAEYHNWLAGALSIREPVG